MPNENDFKIVRVTNISNFDFTPEMGAMYGGRAFAIPAGGNLLAPKTVGDHLAEHLARQIFLKKAPIRDASEVDGKGSDRALWNETPGHENSLENVKAKILSDVYEEDKAAPLSADEIMANKIAELNKMNPTVDNPADSISTSGYKDKAEVIAELTKRGIAFDARASKANLEKLLTPTA